MLRGCVQGIHLAFLVRFEQRQEELLFVLEVRVHGPLGEAGLGRHLVEGRTVEAALGEDLGCRLEEVVPGLLAPAFRGEGFEGHRGLRYLQA